ncbi:hypothetical protein VTH82DRAFT_6331 [Thermothelomyces myriococcoides]
MDQARPPRPVSRAGFRIAILCTRPLEVEAVDALLDHRWDDDDGPRYGKAEDDPNFYTLGVLGLHNVVLIHGQHVGKVHAAMAAVNCRTSFPNIKLMLVVGICSAVPFYGPDKDEIILGDVIISEGVIQHDIGRHRAERFIRNDTLLDLLGRPNLEIRGFLAKLKTRHSRRKLLQAMARYMDVLGAQPGLAASYPGTAQDRLFDASCRHIDHEMFCEECGCQGKLVPRNRLSGEGIPLQPAVHFGLVASGDVLIESSKERDMIALEEDVIAFEMESAGVWDTFPCVVIKGACNYADGHKSKVWERYAAATAAACTKSFLAQWTPSSPPDPSIPVREQLGGSWRFVSYSSEDGSLSWTTLLDKLQPSSN